MSGDMPSENEAYISVDLETAGPIPGEYSLLSLGACLVGQMDKAFYMELQPISDCFVAEAMQVNGLSIAQLKLVGRDPHMAMADFREWVNDAVAGRRPIFVAFNASFDWSFVNWYFHKFLGDNPFGIGGIDIKAYYMGLTGVSWSDTASSKLPPQFQPSRPHTHNALDDARGQAEIFARMLASPRGIQN